jgi:hypothetical protein
MKYTSLFLVAAAEQHRNVFHYGSWSLRQLLLFTRIPLQVSHYRLFQRTANFFTKPKPCYITILKHTMPRSEPGLLVMYFNMAGLAGIEPTLDGP